MQSLSFPGHQDSGISLINTSSVGAEVAVQGFVLFPSLLGWIPVILQAWQVFGNAASCCHSSLPRGETLPTPQTKPRAQLGVLVCFGFLWESHIKLCSKLLYTSVGVFEATTGKT